MSPSSENSELQTHLVNVQRVAKVVKGGRRFAFSALVIIGDGKGRVGFGSGKASEVLAAKTKAAEAAKKNLIRVPLKESRTLHHDVFGKYCSGKVIIKSAKQGTGVIAGGALRAVFECLGVKDVVAKSLGSTNPHNLVKACFSAFENLSSPKLIAAKRNLKISALLERREAA
ncbi:MAG: 30S ribosomal protein S5 [Rickettsiales bacterium]